METDVKPQKHLGRARLIWIGDGCCCCCCCEWEEEYEEEEEGEVGVGKFML